jgi:hypothetical protein
VHTNNLRNKWYGAEGTEYPDMAGVEQAAGAAIQKCVGNATLCEAHRVTGGAVVALVEVRELP